MKLYRFMSLAELEAYCKGERISETKWFLGEKTPCKEDVLSPGWWNELGSRVMPGREIPGGNIAHSWIYDVIGVYDNMLEGCVSTQVFCEFEVLTERVIPTIGRYANPWGSTRHIYALIREYTTDGYDRTSLKLTRIANPKCFGYDVWSLAQVPWISAHRFRIRKGRQRHGKPVTF